jgi:hypothetical protein
MRKVRNYLLTIIILSLVLVIPKNAYAVAWPDIIGQAFGSALDEMLKQIEGMIMGAAKQAAVQAIEGQVSNIIGGGKSGSDGAMFVTDPEKFLTIDPQKDTKVLMNDFFSKTSRGTNSSMNYSSSQSSGGGGGGGSYTKQFEEQAKQSISGDYPQADLQQYTTDTSDLFGQGNWRTFNAYISNPANNTFGYTLMSQQAYMDELQNKKDEAMTKFIAYQGYKGVESDGKVTTPGSTVAASYNNVLDIGNKALADAKTIPEVITAAVTRIITKTITEGIGEIQNNMDRENQQQDTGYW